MTATGTSEELRRRQILLYGPGAEDLIDEVSAPPALTLVESDPGIVVAGAWRFAGNRD